LIGNADRQALTAEQVVTASSLRPSKWPALCSAEANDFIDPAIAQALEQLAASALPIIPVGSKPPDVIEDGKEILAYDVVESVNNTTNCAVLILTRSSQRPRLSPLDLD